MLKKAMIVFLIALLSSVVWSQSLEKGFANPPLHAGVRCWWWWLNGNVTREAITKDLEAMRAKGFSGALIFDAGGADQRGNAQVPAGPLFASPEWTELYLHALKEADRLGLKIGLSIQSGWNLGGPCVTPDFAAKQLTWSELQIEGPVEFSGQLPFPNYRDDYYRDICVLAYSERSTAKKFQLNLKASSFQPGYSPQNSIDMNPETVWVSAGVKQGEGPSSDSPEWLELTFTEPVTVSGLEFQGRCGYGPRQYLLRCIDTGQSTEAYILKTDFAHVRFDPIRGKIFRVLFLDAFDPLNPDSPRNVQVTDIALLDENGKPLGKTGAARPLENLNFKAGFKELGGSAPDCRFLLNDVPAAFGEGSVSLENVQNLTALMKSDGTLAWQVPEGVWTVLRFGYTLTNGHVSTYSGEWKGSVLDYMSEAAFDHYWTHVVDPLLQKAGSLAGTVLQDLETDSWECGGMNWSPGFAADFKKYRGYDPIPYLPVVAGKIINSRDESNAFLADFRKTLADCVSDNHYRFFAENAAQYNIGILPESAGPHAGPIDGIKNYRHNTIVMSEFWVPSPHRPSPPDRFFVKQASSAAHIYGKRYVGAESFTSIGPHWNDVLWQSQKPSMDHEFCSGLNMIFFHTFTCSPKEMGLPGQEYFAGTHINPQVTWWDYSDAFIDYINRIQFIVQQCKFVADALYYYGDHVPNIAALKESDPAKVLPGYDYDVTNEDALLRLKVVDGNIVVPGDIHYRLLVLPDHKVLSLVALEKVAQLLRQGATVLGPKPERLVSLVGGREAQERFHTLADQLWGTSPSETGSKTVGRGCLAWGQTTRQFLQADGIDLDFETLNASEDAVYDYIHYTIGDNVDVYFVCNQTEQPRVVECAFRIAGKRPELWDPLTGRIRIVNAFRQSEKRTTVPLKFDPYGSLFVIFRSPIPVAQNGTAETNFPVLKTVQEIQGPWQVSFDPKWGGPTSTRFDELMDWTRHDNPGIRYYSGKAVYNNTFTLSDVTQNRRWWLVLNDVEDIGIAAVTLNGKDCGITWTKPFRVEITGAIKPGCNNLDITIINSWRNRLVGDRGKPQDQRYTQTNITIQNEWQYLESGLLGPVELKSD